MEEINRSIAKSLDKILINHDNAIWSRLDKIIEKKRILHNDSICYIYTIKQDINGKYLVEELAEYLCHRVAEYVTPLKERKRAQDKDAKAGEGSFYHTSKLISQAKSLFIQNDRSGELGELLLWVLATDVLKLPQLINKMFLKTSSSMHVHGSDGIHVGYNVETGVMSLYWGEAKMYSSFDSALKNCLDSVQDFLAEDGSRRQRDIELISANLDETIIDPKIEKMWADYFDKDKPASNFLKHCAICFIGFDDEKYCLPCNLQQPPESYFQKEITHWIDKLEGKLANTEIFEGKELHFFLMPLKSVQTFRKTFLNFIRA